MCFLKFFNFFLMFPNQKNLFVAIHFTLAVGLISLGVAITDMEPNFFVQLLEHSRTQEYDKKILSVKNKVYKHGRYRFSGRDASFYEYLILTGIQTYCHGDNIILATDHAKNGILTTIRAKDVCLRNKQCHFFSFSGTEIGKIFNQGVTWMCAGDDWILGEAKQDWVTAVHAETIRESLLEYDVSINTATGCKASSVLKSSFNAHVKPKYAAARCSKDPDCTAFVINYGNEYPDTADGLSIESKKKLIYCRELDKSSSVKLNGWITAEKKLKGLIKKTRHYPITPGSDINKTEKDFEASYGPITNDSYYDKKLKGKIVQPTKV